VGEALARREAVALADDLHERDDWHEEPPEPVRDGVSTSGPGGSLRASQTV